MEYLLEMKLLDREEWRRRQCGRCEIERDGVDVSVEDVGERGID